jgi:transcriptional regulator with XRE-family HTH domain
MARQRPAYLLARGCPVLAKSASDSNAVRVEGSRREALGHFLRERRAQIAPDEVGIASRRGRRTPGLRREEVAFLADIGVKWYARLEAGDDVNPSAATLTGIAFALRLSNAELEYVLELAGLKQPLAPCAEVDVTIPPPISALVSSIRGVAVTVGDRILTPLRWNTLADALCGHSRYEHPVERNVLVRSLLDRDIIALLGAEREALVSRAVGMFRLNFWSQRPSPFVAAIYEMVKDHPLFAQLWNRGIVACEPTNDGVLTLNHAVVGRLVVLAREFTTAQSADLVLRTLSPADEETAAKFERLEKIGKGGATKIAMSLSLLSCAFIAGPCLVA